jgi:hypothetical protein
LLVAIKDVITVITGVAARRIALFSWFGENKSRRNNRKKERNKKATKINENRKGT